MADDQVSQRVRELERRLERLEKFMGISDLQCAPGFDPLMFHRIMMGYFARLAISLGIVFVVLMLLAVALQGKSSESTLWGLPLFVEGTSNREYPVSLFGLPLGIVAIHGIGLLSFGGLGIGAVAIGGGALGIVAIGGGAVGLVAFGGGAFGAIAFGGGAVGYIAVGGGAYGVYVLAGDGKGRYVFDRRRQDEAAVRLFCKCLPRLRHAFTQESASPAPTEAL